jgi:hypothetical protein
MRCDTANGIPQGPPCPSPGQGVNRWLLSAANRLRAQGIPKGDAEKLIRGTMTRSEKGNEVHRALQKAFSGTPTTTTRAGGFRNGLQLPKARPNHPRIEEIDADAISRVTSSGFRYDDLKSISPISLVPPTKTCSIIKALFPTDCLICCSKAQDWGAETKLISEFGDGLDGFSFIVPQTMTKRLGLTQEKPPKSGPRTLDNTGPWRFFVYESDSLPLDDQAAVIYELACIHPLALAVFSGSKSIHAYFYVGALSEQELLDFQRLAIRLGGCTGPLNRCQLVRMPGGFNYSTKRLQDVLYFNPNAIL